MTSICEHLGDKGLCIPLNAFNIGDNRGTVTCQSVGCEDACQVRRIMNQHNRKLAQLRQEHQDSMRYLEEHTAAVLGTGRKLQDLPSLFGIRALGARFSH